MPYTTLHYFELINALAIRLSDQDHDFWSENELKSYLIEALRTWQVFAVSNYTRITLPTVANTLFYDLFQLVPELTPTVTDREVIRDIAFATQEPINPTTGVWIGTEQFSSAAAFPILIGPGKYFVSANDTTEVVALPIRRYYG